METAGDRIKHTSLAMASEAFRLITSDKVKKAYEGKKKKAEAKGEKVVWGRKKGKYPIERIKELRNEGLGFKKISKKIKKENGKEISYQTIRRLLQNTHEGFTHKKP